ncbi:MAG: methyltransferase domain-containing protein [Anaerolineae bacterium]|nr:methyltransferase domain-containing protein [Anaerolineae bacterium]
MSSPGARLTPWLRLIRAAFWVLYNPLAWAYDGVSWLVSAGRWRAWQRVALAHVCGERVLELAFGTGDLLLDLAASGQRGLVGLDLSPNMARIAQRKLRRAGFQVPLVRGRAQQLPFTGASLDTVLSTFPAEFAFAPATLSEIARVLAPEGRAVVVGMAQFVPDTLWEWILEWLYRVTGQRAPLSEIEAELDVQLGALGLERRVEWRCEGRSHVLLFVLSRCPPVERLDGCRALG